MQVSGKIHCFRSDNQFIIVFPCPQILLVLVDCFTLADLLLSLSSDESNPGPGTEQLIKKVLEAQKTILAKLTEIQNKQASSETSIQQIQTRLTAIENILASLDETQDRIDKLEELVSRNDHDIQYLE